MLSTKEIPAIDIKALPPFIAAAMGSEDEGNRGYLILGLGEQIIGGGIRSGDQIVACWIVSDVTADHWIKLIHPSSDIVQIGRVNEGMVSIVRKTLDRFSADANRRIAAEAHIKQGVNHALSTVVATMIEGMNGE